MLDLKSSSRNASEGQSSSEDSEARKGRPEMVVVIGIVALVSMIFGFALGLLF